MRVRVLLFGLLAEIYGAREEWLELPDTPDLPSTAADLYLLYRERDARIGELERSVHIAVNQVVVDRTHTLAPGDEVALLPPVCGGTDDIASDLIDLIEAPLEDHSWRKHLHEGPGGYGAVVSFEGLVREESPVAPVRALAFEAYRPMTLTALATLAAGARERWPLQRIVVLHRLGIVPVGKICVVVAVAAGHREEAFAACKYLIDTLKATVPIWKKEITASGSHWVEGLPLSSPVPPDKSASEETAADWPASARAAF